MTQPNGKRDWTPLLQANGVYCSSACGMGCTYAAYLQAQSDAQALCAVLGDGWKAEVWENLGWHWRARKGKADMRQYPGDKEYYSSFQGSPQFFVHGRTPRGTFDKLRTVLYNHVNDIENAICELEA